MLTIHDIKLNELETETVCFQCERPYKLNRTSYGKKVPLCSFQCALKYVAEVIRRQDYDNKTLSEMWSISLNGKETPSFNKEKAIYDISQYLGKHGKGHISYIISQYMNRDKGQGQETQGQEGLSTHRDKNRDKTHYMGSCPLVPMSTDCLLECPSVRSLSLFSKTLKMENKK